MVRYLLVVLTIVLLCGGAYFNSVLLYLAGALCALCYVADALDFIEKEERDGDETGGSGRKGKGT